MTLSEWTEIRDAYKACLLAILGGAQSYQINGRILTRANLAEVRAGLSEAQRNVEALAVGRAPGPRFGRFMPRDI